MSDWKPKTRSGLDWSKLDLAPDEGFVLSRIDGATSLKDIGHLSGLPDARVSDIIGKLERAGVLESRAAASAPSTKASSAKASSSAGARAARSMTEPVATLVEAPTFDATLELPRDASDDDGDVFDTGLTSTERAEIEREILGSDEDFLGEATVDGPAHDDTGEDGGEEAPERAVDDAKDDDAKDDDAKDDDAKGDDARAADEEEEAAEKDDEAFEQATANYRKLFNEKYADLEVDARVHAAQTESGADLLALAFDPQARVVIAVVENISSGLDHARLIATHHRTAVGLQALAKNQAFLRDTQTQRALLKNPLLPDTLFRTIMAPKRMAETYRLSLSRELTERTKTAARNLFRKKFTEGTPEERVALVFQCEGRCLNLLLGVTVDARTASLMCQRQMLSTLLIQNLCRFPSTPPPVLVHMAKQQLVKRTPSLKQLVVRHPNAPSTLKRGGA